MPMVSESSSDPSRLFKVYSNGSLYDNVTVPNGVTRFQTGYRSGPLSLAEQYGAELKAGNWGNVRSQISYLEEAGAEYLGKPERAFMVHDRDYSETTYSPCSGHYTTTFRFGSSLYTWSNDWVIGITGVTGGIPSWPSTSVLESKAAKMMRLSVPTRSEIDLVRMIGEQKDFSSMLRTVNYVPKTGTQFAGSILNYLFGLQPTVSDLMSLADLAVKWDPILRRYVRQEQVRLRRKSSQVLWEGRGSGALTAPYPEFYRTRDTMQMGNMNVRVAQLLPGSYASSTMSLAPEVHWSWKARQTLSMFATFEYFIPKPRDLESRLSRYRQLAQRALGSGLTPSTVYDLSPWTWLSNWIVDVGGLLRYQQNVIDNQVAASSAGYSVWEEYAGQVGYMGRHVTKNGWGVEKDSFLPNMAFLSWRRHRRRPGNPYSISPTWDLSQQQWAILGTLGIARSEGVPIIGH